MKKVLLTFIILVLCAGASACKGNDNVDEDRLLQINYISNDEIKLVARDYVIESDLSDTEAQVEEVLHALETTSEKLEYKTPLSADIEVIDFELNEGNLTLYMCEKYSTLPVPLEVLTRAALVKSLVQIDGVNYVGMMINDTHLTDSLGSPIGMMNVDTFVDNEDNQINSMEQVRIKLYFTDETGTKLVAVNRTLVYSTNVSLEKLVVEQLISGPTEFTRDLYPTLNPETKVLGVTINDGTCYVNLDEGFLTQLSNATAEVVIYSIANSLIELSNVNKIQISVNGETDIMYRETMTLKTIYERNLDLVSSIE